MNIQEKPCFYVVVAGLARVGLGRFGLGEFGLVGFGMVCFVLVWVRSGTGAQRTSRSAKWVPAS